MTGMKEGAGEDPFASNSTTSDDSDQTETDVSSEKTATTPDTDQTEESRSSIQIPYKFRRDGVQDGRDRVPLFLKSDTKQDERDALRELEARFEDDVSLTDLREGLVKVGLDHLDEVERQLEEWGYGMTFDE